MLYRLRISLVDTSLGLQSGTWGVKVTEKDCTYEVKVTEKDCTVFSLQTAWLSCG